MDLQATAEKLSSRCLSLRKDFVVFTLGPLGSIRVDPNRLKVWAEVWRESHALNDSHALPINIIPREGMGLTSFCHL